LGRLLLLLMPLAATGNAFVAFIVGLQLIATVSTPAYTSLMRDIYPDNARGRLMGYVRVIAQSMAFLATLITGRLLDAHVSFRYLFPVAGVFGLLAAWAFFKVRPLPHIARQEPPPPSSGGAVAFIRETLAILKHNLPYRYFALSVFIYGFANLMVQPLYQLYQVDVLQITGTQIANLANLASLLAIAGSFFWGRFMDRYGPPMTVMASIGLIAVIPIVYLFADSVTFLFFAAALSGFGFAGVELSYLSSILLYAEPGRTAQYQSLHSLLLGVRGVLASLVGVPLATHFGYKNIFLVALLVMLVGSGLQYLAIRAASEKR
jgi:MFS transporter, DHA1 family, inner membrane transport protein